MWLGHCCSNYWINDKAKGKLSTPNNVDKVTKPATNPPSNPMRVARTYVVDAVGKAENINSIVAWADGSLKNNAKPKAISGAIT